MGGRFELLGWGLFFVSGVVFVIAALRDGDALLFWGSLTWLLAVVLFLFARPRS